MPHLPAARPARPRGGRVARRTTSAVAAVAAAGLALGAAPAFASQPAGTPSAGTPSAGTPSAGTPSAVSSRPAASRGALGAADWLAHRFVGPFIPSSTSPTTPDDADTAESVLALAASRTHEGTVHAAMRYLERHVRTAISVTVAGTRQDDPGAIAFLILDAHAAGASARSFGGVNLVDRLLATMRPSGADAGLFGAAAPTFDGAYRQGLALAALAGVDTTARRLAPAVHWLQRQQCAGGGWESYRAKPSVACAPRDPKTFTGPDTNSTALAVEGLRATQAKIPFGAFGFFLASQDRNGGWGYQGAPSDPDSTALVRQALISLGQAHSPKVKKAGGTPRSALLGYQITAGPNAGAFGFPGVKGPSLIATEQALPALVGTAFPVQPLIHP